MTTAFMDENEAQTVPTPNQIPERIDLSRLPQQMLRTGAVEALANQNEDLVARLGVALRRSVQLENKIAEQESQIKTLEFQAAMALDEALVLKEKDQTIVAQFAQLEADAKTKSDHLQMLEAQFAELYATNKDRVRALNNLLEDRDQEVSRLGRTLERFKRFRARIKKAKTGVRRKATLLTTYWKREEEANRELKARLGEAGLRIQQMSKDADSHQRQLVDSYEATLKTLRQEMAELDRQNKAYAAKTDDYQTLYERSVVLENSLIKEQRLFSEYKQVKDSEIGQLQIDLSQCRAENKTLLIENQDMKTQYAQLTDSHKDQMAQISAFKDQVETLQLLWQDGQTQMERVNGKNQALQKLNQQLSQTITQLRHDMQTVRGELEAQNFSTTERIKEIKGHIQMIAKPELDFIEDAEAPKKVLTRIDTLIAEIQSGFQAKGSVGGIGPATTSSDESSMATDNLGKGNTSSP